MGSLERIWQEVQENLRKKLSPSTFTTVTSIIVPIKLDQDQVFLSVPNDYLLSWYEGNYQNLFENAFSEIMGESIKVIFQANANITPNLLNDDKTTSNKENKKKNLNDQELLTNDNDDGQENLTTNENDEEENNVLYTFDNFVVGDGNELAYNSCLGVSKKPGLNFNPLFIYGPSGVGKTHLLNAICHYIKHHKRRIITKMISADEFLNEFLEALRDGKMTAFRKTYRKLDVLLIDDIHFIADKEKTQEEFFHTFNTLFNARKQIVMVSDREPKDIKGLQARLVSRFEWGLTVDVKPPNLETRMAILSKKVKDQNITISKDIIKLIAERIRTNVRRLEGALMKVIATASFQKEEITVQKAEELLQTWFWEEDKNANSKQVTISDIQKIVAEYYDIRLADMSSKARPANIALARQVAMYLCRKLTTLSAPAIGEAFRRNHTTVLHAVETIGKRMEKDKNFEREVLVLEHRFAQI